MPKRISAFQRTYARLVMKTRTYFLDIKCAADLACFWSFLLSPILVVHSAMVTTKHYFQISYAVIKSITIFMMNDFAPLQSATKMAFHYKAMLKNNPAVYPKNFVTTGRDMPHTSRPCFNDARITMCAESTIMRLAESFAQHIVSASLHCASFFHYPPSKHTVSKTWQQMSRRIQ